MALLTVFVYTDDIEHTSAAKIQDALNQHSFTAEDVCVRPIECLSDELADVIRREVRWSAGIEEGQEFRCDWSRVAAVALATVHRLT